MNRPMVGDLIKSTSTPQCMHALFRVDAPPEGEHSHNAKWRDSGDYIIVSPFNEADPSFMTVLSEDGRLWQMIPDPNIFITLRRMSDGKE